MLLWCHAVILLVANATGRATSEEGVTGGGTLLAHESPSQRTRKFVNGGMHEVSFDVKICSLFRAADRALPSMREVNLNIRILLSYIKVLSIDASQRPQHGRE